MRHLQTAIVLCVILLVVVINLAPDFSYKGMQHPVGAEAVQVFQSTLADHDFEQPVWRWGSEGGPIDTGQRVLVELRSDYRDPHLLAKPDLTLFLIGSFVLLYVLARLVAHLASSARRQSSRTS